MRVIKLTHGKGNGLNQACLMTASNMLVGRGTDGDENSCVCPLLRSFIVPTNDAMPEELLAELYTPLIWEILGTRTEDREVLQARADAFVDWAVREIAPIALRCRGFEAEAAKLESLPAIIDVETARAAAHAAYAAAHAANAANAAANAAYAAVNAANAASAEIIWRKCPEIIRRVASIGDKRPVECVINEDQLACALGEV